MAKKCLLKDPNCKENCGCCGWNPNEVNRRKLLFYANGLTKCKDGLKRLIIKRGVTGNGKA